MKRIKAGFKYLIIFITTLIIISIISVALFIYLFPKDRLLAIITETAETQLNRKVFINNINYSFNGVSLSNLRILNSKDKNDIELLKADNVSLGFSPLSLLEKKLIINHITLDGLKINITYENEIFNIEQFLREILKLDKKEKSKDKEVTKEKIEKTSEKDDKDQGIKTTISYIKLINASLWLKSAPSFLKPLIGKYSVNGKLVLANKDKISIQNILVNLPKKRGIVTGELLLDLLAPEFVLKGNLKLNNVLTKWTYTWADNLSLPFKQFNGKLNNFHITPNYLEFNVDGKTTIENNDIINLSGYSKIKFRPIELLYSNLEANIRDSSAFLKTFKINLQTKDISFNFDSLDIDFSDIKGIVKEIPKKLTGKVSGSLSLKDKKVNGKLKISNTGYGLEDKIISNINGDILINNNYFRIEKLPFKFYGQNAQLSAASTYKSYKDIVANLTIKEFTLPERKIQSTTNVDDSKQLNYESTELNIPLFVKGRIDIGKLNIDKDISFSDIMLSYNFTKNKLNIPQLRTNFLDSTFIGSGNATALKNKTNINCNIRFNDLKVQKLSKFADDNIPKFFGNANGKVDLSFDLEKDKKILESIKGNAQFRIDNGKVSNTGIQNGLGIWLEPLKHKLQDLEFDVIYGNFSVAGLTYNINSFVFNSPNIRLALNGFFKKSLEGDLKINLEFNKSFIQDLPKLATLPLLRDFKKGKWYTFTFRDKGDDITDSKNIKRID